jgi:hypothetical protein
MGIKPGSSFDAPETEAHRHHHLIELTRDVEGHLVRKYVNDSSSVQPQTSTALLADPDSDYDSDISLFIQLGIIISVCLSVSPSPY